MRQYLWPMRHVLGASAAMSLVVGVIEIWLVGYVGRLVDLLQDTPRGDFWALYGLEVLAVGGLCHGDPPGAADRWTPRS
jgi:ATP-binding cassette subfamily B multidrug efflux pump